MAPLHGQPITVRVSESTLKDLKGLTIVHQESLAELVRRAIDVWVDSEKARDDLAEIIQQRKQERLSSLADLAEMAV